MERRNGQWVVSQVNLAPRADAPKGMLPKPVEGMPPKPVAKNPLDVIRIDYFLGISPDFKAYAMKVYAISAAYGVSSIGFKGVKIVDLETGKNLVSPKWDRDWGHPFLAAFGKEVIAVATTPGDKEPRGSVKIFSRKTGELEKSIYGGRIDRAAFTANGRFLAITQFRAIDGFYLVLRDVQEKQTVAELRLGGTGYCSLAVAGEHAAAHESESDQITVVKAEMGKLMEKLNSGSFRKRERFARDRMPLAISPTGNLIGCGTEDDVVLYDIATEKVAHKLKGHPDTVEAVAFSPNGEVVASAARDKTIRFWNVQQGKEIHVIKSLPANPKELIFSTDGDRIGVVYPELRKAEIRSVGLK